MPTPSRRSPRPARRAAPTRKAADDGSPGTRRSRGRSAGGAPPGSRRTRAPPSSGPKVIGAPMASRSRSVWSRERPGSTTSTSVPEARPARRRQDLTWALATRGRCRRVRRAPEARARSSIGRYPRAPRYSILAPMAWSGYTTRSMGLHRRESSPLSTALRPRPAARPATSRAVVPLFPQSRISSASRHAASPGSRTRPDQAEGMSAPRPRSTSAVERTSAASSRFSTRESPRASPASISTRWEIDLSPGTRMTGVTEPRRRRPAAAPPGWRRPRRPRSRETRSRPRHAGDAPARSNGR